MLLLAIIISCVCHLVHGSNVHIQLLSASTQLTDNEYFKSVNFTVTGDTEKKLQAQIRVEDINDSHDLIGTCMILMDNGVQVGPASLSYCDGIVDNFMKDFRSYGNWPECPMPAGTYDIIDYAVSPDILPLYFPRGQGTVTFEVWKGDEYLEAARGGKPFLSIAIRTNNVIKGLF